MCHPDDIDKIKPSWPPYTSSATRRSTRVKRLHGENWPGLPFQNELHSFFFISNSIFLSRLELLMFWAKMRLKVAMELLRFLTDFGTKFEK